MHTKSTKTKPQTILQSCLEGHKHDFRFLDFKNTIVYLCILIDSQKSECKKSCYQQDTAKKMM